MKPFVIVYGVVGLVVAGYIAMNFYRILENLRSHQDVSLSMFFLSEESIPAFRVLLYGTLFYAIIAPLAGVGLMFGPSIRFYGVSGYEAVVEAVSIVALLATIYWQRKVISITMRPSEREN